MENKEQQEYLCHKIKYCMCNYAMEFSIYVCTSGIHLSTFFIIYHVISYY